MDEMISKLVNSLELSKYDSHKPWIIVGTSESSLNIVCEVLARKLNCTFQIEVIDDIKNLPGLNKNKSLSLKIGDTFDNSLLSNFGFHRVARVWQEGEYSLNGDIITFWAKGNKNVVRISLLGNVIEEIAFLDFNTRMLIEKKTEVFVSHINDFVRNVYTCDRGVERRRAFFVRNIQDFDDIQFEYIDLGVFQELGKQI